MTTPNEQAGTVTQAELDANKEFGWYVDKNGYVFQVLTIKPRSVRKVGRLEGFRANTTPHSELAPQTTPSKADSVLTQQELEVTLLIERLAMVPRFDNEPTATYDKLELKKGISDLITTTLTQQREELLAQLPEPATETKTLGKDYSGYSRCFNAAINKVTAIIKGEK